MRIFTLFGSVLFLASISSFAQNQDSISIRKYYEENTIYWPGWNKYYKNSQVFQLKDLQKEIIYSPEAILEFKKYQQNRTGLEISAAIGIGLAFSTLLVPDRNTKLGLAAGSLAAFTVALPFSFATSKHLSRAIWLHNRDVLLK